MSDEAIWQLIGGKKKFCAFKLNTDTQVLCKNENNVTGLCDESSCPLSNSKYATVRDIDGRIYLFVKEPERVNLPMQTYERILLSADYDKAIEEIENILKYWHPSIIHKCKQRLGKLTQYLIRRHELKNDKNKVVYAARRKKALKIERRKGIKTMLKVDIDREIKNELLIRLQDGLYGDHSKLKINRKLEEADTKTRKRIFIAEFEESDDYCDNKAVTNKKKEKLKLIW